MSIMKKIIKLLSILLGFVVLYFAISHTLTYFVSDVKIGGKKDRSIYLYTGKEGLFSHSEIILNIKDFTKEELDLFKKRTLGGVNWLSFSYGDRDFMMDEGGFEDIDYILGAKSLFLDTPALMKVGFFYDFARDLTTKIDLNSTQLKNLKSSIIKSFKTDGYNFIEYNATIYNPDFSYFEARKDYNLFHTCNSWSGEMLRAAKIKMSPWTPLAYQIDLSLKRGQN